MSLSPKLQLPYPEPGDPNDVPADLQALALAIEDAPGITSVTTTERDAFTAPQKWLGRIVYNETTSKHEQWNGTAWVATGITDHGLLGGLADDDHTQYALADGSRGNFASPSHTHSAAAIVSGTMEQARLVPNIVRVLHNGTTYPARPTGVTYVEWVGPTQPTEQINGDTWVATA